MIYNIFNKDLLIKYREPHFPEQQMELAPLPDIINKEEEYKVEEIRKYRKQGQETQFLVYWKSHRDEHNQWIAETGLSYAKEAIEDYFSGVSSQNL